MTFLYRAQQWASSPQANEDTIKYWEHVSQKKNWRIVQLQNGFYQTEYKHPDKEEEYWVDVTRRETIEGAEQAIDASIEHYSKKLEFANGPKVVKTFK
jgi:uncharacterized protein YbcI